MDIKKIVARGAIAVVAWGLATAPASALVFTAIYKGTVASGFDTTGVFGAANTDLTGATFEATFTVDTLGPGSLAEGPVTIFQGGTIYGYPGSPISSDFKLNGVTQHINGDELGQLIQYSRPLGAYEDYQTFDSVTTNDPYTRYIHTLGVYVGSDAHLFTPEFPDITHHIKYTVRPEDISGGTYVQQLYRGDTQSYTVLARANLIVTSFESGVPDPATWSLMIAGFGLTGAALRRCRRLDPQQAGA